MHKKILLVEDERQLLDLTAMQLEERCGAEVIKAESAEEAIELLNETQFFMVITDLKLDGQSGVDLCKHIRETNPVSFVLAVTGHQSLFQLVECRSVGFDDYFLKPVDFYELSRVVDSMWSVMTRWLKFNAS